jgi:hypothetical protein
MASMPTLALGSPPPMSAEDLKESCEGRMPERDRLELVHFTSRNFDACTSTFARKWAHFEETLMGKIAGLRAGRWQLDPTVYAYANYGKEDDSFIDRVIVEAYAKSNPRERERVLDKARWQILEDLVIQTPFGLCAVLATCVKLDIMTRWYAIHRDRGAKELATALKTILQPIGEKPS